MDPKVICHDEQIGKKCGCCGMPAEYAAVFRNLDGQNPEVEFGLRQDLREIAGSRWFCCPNCLSIDAASFLKTSTRHMKFIYPVPAGNFTFSAADQALIRSWLQAYIVKHPQSWPDDEWFTVADNILLRLTTQIDGGNPVSLSAVAYPVDRNQDGNWVFQHIMAAAWPMRPDFQMIPKGARS